MSFLHHMTAELKKKLRMKILKHTVITSYVPAPDGTILFRMESDGIRLCGDDIPRSGAWLLGYNFKARSFCYTDRTRIVSDRISNETLIKFGRSVFPVVNSSKPGVCLYYPETGRTYSLLHDETEKISASNVILICTERSAVPDPDTHCLVIIGNGSLHVGTVRYAVKPADTVTFSPDILKSPDIIDVRDHLNTADKSSFCYYGIYNRKKLCTEALFPVSGGLRLSQIVRYFASAREEMAGEKHIFLAGSTAEAVSSYIRIADDSDEAAKPFRLDNTYDILLLKPQPVNDKKSAAFLRTKNGTVYINLLPSANLEKYHDVITGAYLPEGADRDLFRRYDPEETEITEAGFFSFIAAASDALDDKKISESGRFLLKERIITNLSAMITQAADFRNTYAPDPPINGEGWGKLHALMQRVEDDIITRSDTSAYMKSLLLNCKYGRVDLEEQIKGLYLKFGSKVRFRIDILQIRIDIIEVKNNTLSVEGFVRIPESVAENDVQVAAFVNGAAVETTAADRYTGQYVFGKLFYRDQEFILNLPLSEARCSIVFGIKCRGVLTVMEKISFMDLAPITNSMPGNYLYQNGYVIRASKDRLSCTACPDKKGLAEYENYFISRIRDRAGSEAERIISMRKKYWDNQAEPNKKSKWLFIDRPDRADDNAEALFRYAVEKNYPGIEPIFILDRCSPAFSELSELGKVLSFRSDEHLQAFLDCDYVFSSQFGPSTRNPFNEEFDYFRDIIRQKKIIYLQHGVTKDNNGPIFGRYGRNCYGFITSGKGETEFFESDLFHYSNGQIWQTGLPRFDLLRHDDRHIITIMPTWRKDLTVRTFDETEKTDYWKVRDSFADSEYFKFYNSLINNDRLIKAAKGHNYTIMFMLHPHFLKKADLFENNHPDVVSICTYDIRYRDLFAMSSLIVTDFSSAVFDFVYMHKPVIYCQFDKEEFYQHHTLRPGYFDYERDGFGEVVYNMSDAVETVISYLETGCRMKEKYVRRVDSFFKYIDHSCRERICEKVFTPENKR